MKLFIDGKEVPCNGSVTIVHEDQIIDQEWKPVPDDPDGEEEHDLYGEVHIICTGEGIIVDCINDGEVNSTGGLMVEDLIEMTQ